MTRARRGRRKNVASRVLFYGFTRPCLLACTHSPGPLVESTDKTFRPGGYTRMAPPSLLPQPALGVACRLALWRSREGEEKKSRACSGGNVWEIRGPKMGIVQKYPSSARATPPPTTKLAAADAPSITTPAPANQPYQTGDPGLFPICPPNLQYDFFSSMGGRRQQAGRVRSNSPS